MLLLTQLQWWSASRTSSTEGSLACRVQVNSPVEVEYTLLWVTCQAGQQQRHKQRGSCDSGPGYQQSQKAYGCANVLASACLERSHYSQQAGQMSTQRPGLRNLSYEHSLLVFLMPTVLLAKRSTGASSSEMCPNHQIAAVVVCAFFVAAATAACPFKHAIAPLDTQYTTSPADVDPAAVEAVPWKVGVTEPPVCCRCFSVYVLHTHFKRSQ
jgi:hypothetical protein